MTLTKPFFPFLGFLLLFFLLWEGAALYTTTDLAFILPRPSAILSRLVATPHSFYTHAWVTLTEIVLGFALAFLIALITSLLMLWSPLTSAALQPLFVLIQCIPMFTLAPLMLLLFGWSSFAIILPTALMLFLPLTLSFYRGFMSTPPRLLDFFKMNGASPTFTFFKLRLPWALPHFFSGMRISLAMAGIGAIAGEWAGAQQGLGVLMQESRRNADFSAAFAALFCLISLTLTLYLILIFAEKYILKKFHSPC